MLTIAFIWLLGATIVAISSWMITQDSIGYWLPTDPTDLPWWYYPVLFAKCLVAWPWFVAVLIAGSVKQ